MLISSHLLPTSSTLSKSSVSRLVVLLHTFAFSHAASLQGPVPDMVSVGVLAAIINIIVLFIISIADRAIELIIRNFATSRLFRLRRAPVIHDSDTWLLNIPRSLLKYRHNPGMYTCSPSFQPRISNKPRSHFYHHYVHRLPHCRGVTI